MRRLWAHVSCEAQAANQDTNLRGAAIYFHRNPSDLFPTPILLGLPDIISCLDCNPFG
jgi:hypothetical protein